MTDWTIQALVEAVEALDAAAGPEVAGDQSHTPTALSHYRAADFEPWREAPGAPAGPSPETCPVCGSAKTHRYWTSFFCEYCNRWLTVEEQCASKAGEGSVHE